MCMRRRKGHLQRDVTMSLTCYVHQGSSSSFPSLIVSPPFHGICSTPLWKNPRLTLSLRRAATVQQCSRLWHRRSAISHKPRFLLQVPKRISSCNSSSLNRMLTSLVFLMALGTKLEPLPPGDLFNSMPPNLSGSEKPQRVQRPKSPKAERCTQKCVTTCIRGGAGSPGEGPLNVRRPLVVFKEGFRTRQYCLVECSDICNLIGDEDDGP